MKNLFEEAISFISSYYREKKNSEYKNLAEKLEANKKELEKKFINFVDQKIITDNSFQEEVLTKYNTELLLSTIKSLFQELNIPNSINKELEHNLTTNEFSQKLNHFNILILGRAGIGKTTLINSILQFEGTDKELLTGEGTSKTIGPPIGYVSDSVKGLRLWDSQGIDKEKYNIPKVVEDVKELINQASINNDPDKFIHCIWYCISGNRFETSESESISELMSIYDDDTLPIIIVYTEAYSDKIAEDVCFEVKKVLNDIVNKEKIKEINIIPVLAKDKEIIVGDISDTVEKYGIKPLMDISVKKIMGAVNSACFFSFKNKLKKDYEKKIEDMCEIIKNGTNEIIQKFQPGNIISNINLLNSGIIKNKIMKKLLEYQTLTENSKTLLNKLLKNYQEYIDKQCNKNLSSFLSKCISDSIIEYKKENVKGGEEDNEDEANIREKMNIYTMNYMQKKGDEKKSNIKKGGGQEDTTFEKIKKNYLDNIVKISSRFLDNLITDEIAKLMIQTFNEMANNYDEKIQNKVKESMNQQSLNIMEELKFE
jgi:hypothetical protein